MPNSCKIGKRFELADSHIWTDGGIDAKRGQQHAAIGEDGSINPDIVFTNPNVDLYHECKRRKKGAGYLFDWVDQALEEAPENHHVYVAYQIDRRRILSVSDLKHQVKREKELMDLRAENKELRQSLDKLCNCAK